MPLARTEGGIAGDLVMVPDPARRMRLKNSPPNSCKRRRGCRLPRG